MNTFKSLNFLVLLAYVASVGLRGHLRAARPSGQIDENEIATHLGTTGREVHTLVESLDGEVMAQSTPAFNQTARAEFLLPQWQSPHRTAVLVLANSTEDVQKAVAWSARNNISLSPAAGRHGSAAYCLKSALTVDLRRMNSLVLDEDSLVLTAGAGVLLGDIISYLSPRGYVTATGVCEGVGIAGWTLGGGYGPFSKLMGLGVDNVLSSTQRHPSIFSMPFAIRMGADKRGKF